MVGGKLDASLLRAYTTLGMQGSIKSRFKNLLVALPSFAPIFAALAMVTVFTAATHAGTCARLTGFPGFLQRVGFVSTGPCASKPGGAICGGGASCTTVRGTAGNCRNLAAFGQPPNCGCVASAVSRGLK